MVVEARTNQDWVFGAVKDAEAVETYRELGIKFFTVPPDVQDQIIQRSKELVDKNIAEDPLYAQVWQSQYDFLRKWKQLNNLLIPQQSLFSVE